MKKYKIKSQRIPVPTYFSDVWIIVCSNEQLVPWIKKNIKDPYRRNSFLNVIKKREGNWDYVGSQIGSGGGSSVIHMAKYSKTVLIHELLHAGIWLLKQKDISINNQTEEAYVYLTEYLIAEALKLKQP